MENAQASGSHQFSNSVTLVRMQVEKAGLWHAPRRQENRAHFLTHHSVSSSSFSAHFVLRRDPLTKVDVRNFSKQFLQQASQESAQGIIRNVASGGSSLFLISDCIYSGLQSRSVGIR